MPSYFQPQSNPINERKGKMHSVAVTKMYAIMEEISKTLTFLRRVSLFAELETPLSSEIS